MTDAVTEFRRRRVEELDALIQGCADERLDIASEVANVVSRMRELYFFAPDMTGMVEHLRDVFTQNNLLEWARDGNDRSLSELPWGKVHDAAERLLTEPPLHQRDWSTGAIQPQYGDAISGWVDLRHCARRARADSGRAERIDDVQLLVGATTVFRFGATENFKILRSPAADLLEDVFQAILGRDDLDLDMFPSALTYFGSDGLMVLNRLAAESEGLYEALLRFADQGMFDDEQAAPLPADEPPPQPRPPRPPPPPSAAAPRPPAAAGSAAPVLTKGANVSLTKGRPGLRSVLVVLGWDARTTEGTPFDLDASAIACGEDRRVLSDGHFVFYNNPTSPDGTIVHQGDDPTGEAGGEVIVVDLAAMPAEVTNVYFPVSIYDEHRQALTFGQVRNAVIRIVDGDDDTELAGFDLGEDASAETAMVFGELYRRGAEWKFRAVGQGYSDGLAGIAREYGVNV